MVDKVVDVLCEVDAVYDAVTPSGGSASASASAGASSSANDGSSSSSSSAAASTDEGNGITTTNLSVAAPPVFPGRPPVSILRTVAALCKEDAEKHGLSPRPDGQPLAHEPQHPASQLSSSITGVLYPEAHAIVLKRIIEQVTLSSPPAPSLSHTLHYCYP